MGESPARCWSASGGNSYAGYRNRAGDYSLENCRFATKLIPRFWKRSKKQAQPQFFRFPPVMYNMTLMRTVFKMVSKAIACGFGVLLLIGMSLQAAPTVKQVYAQTSAALQAQINDLHTKIALVQAQLGMGQTVSTIVPPTFRFSRTLAVGARGADVRYLQELLNRDTETRVNAPGLLGGAGNETEYFGGATKAAVIRFQNKYATDVLRPAGLSRGTGLVATLTRNKLNTLLTTLQVSATPNIPIIVPLVMTAPTPPSPVMPETPVVTAPVFSFDEINQKTRAALVNILCTSRRGGSFNPISGSGVIVDPRGIILTNAHVGQYFLIRDFLMPGNIECVIRTGEPARNRYKATLLFISPDWVRDNAPKIAMNEPTGTGENDFALLLITDTTDPANPLPEVFPFVPMDLSGAFPTRPTAVLAAGYPAGFLSGINIQKDLYPSSSVVTTGTVYSFGERSPDIFSIGGSVVAQHGSSGGAIVSQEYKLLGLIVTSTTGDTTGERDLNALTMSHISESYRKQTGEGIESLLGSDLKARAQSFNTNSAPELKKLLENALLGQ